MKDAVLFAARYDVPRLEADLAAAEQAAEWLYKPERGKYFRWSAIPLWSLEGRLDLDAMHRHVSEWDAGRCGPTPILERCAYLREVIDGLESEKLRVRLMRLEPGGTVGSHVDRHYGWEQPILRFHVPIRTHPDVEFVLNEKRVAMLPGELWYLDTTKPHEVHNRSEVERVHLVIDVVNTPAARERFGPATWERWL